MYPSGIDCFKENFADLEEQERAIKEKALSLLRFKGITHHCQERICVPIEEVDEINDFERRTNATIAATLKNPPGSERSQQVDLQRNHLIEVRLNWKWLIKDICSEEIQLLLYPFMAHRSSGFWNNRVVDHVWSNFVLQDVGVCLEEIKLDGDVEARELERGYVAFDTKDEPAKGVASFTSDGDRHEPSWANHSWVHFVLFADGIYNVWVKKAKKLLPSLVKTPSLSIMNNVEEKGPVAPGKAIGVVILLRENVD
ncbi:hypothetical protein Tco_1397457 [Tanacetum coccineum]